MSKRDVVFAAAGVCIGLSVGTIARDLRYRPEIDAARAEGKMLGVCGALGDVVRSHPDVEKDAPVAETLRYCVGLRGTQ